MAQIKLSDGRYADVFATVQDVQPGTWNYAPATGGIVNSVVAVTIVPALAGSRNQLSSLQISTDALGAATELAVRDGAGGAVLWRMKLGTAALQQAQMRFNPPLRGTAGNLLEVVTLTASVTGGVFFNAQGSQAA